LIAGAIGVVSAVIYFGRQPGETPSESLKIGANLSLSGNSPYWSQQVKHGLDVAAALANQDTGSRRVELVYLDNQGEAKVGISNFQRLVNIDKVSCVLTAHTYIANPQRALAASSKVPLLATIVSAVGFGAENEWSFLDWPTQEQMAPATAQYAFEELGARKVATLVVNDPYGLDGSRNFVRSFEALGGKILSQVTIDNKDFDARDELLKALDLKPDALFVVAREGALANAVRQARELGFRKSILGVNAFDSPVVWKAAGDAANGVIFSSSFLSTIDNAEHSAFERVYRAQTKEEPDWVSLFGYSIGKYLIASVRSANGDPEAIRKALGSLNEPSLRGAIHMNASREVASTLGLFKRVSGRNELLHKIEPLK